MLKRYEIVGDKNRAKVGGCCGQNLLQEYGSSY